VDDYITGQLVEPDPALDGALDASRQAGLPPIHVAPPQGKFLHLLARIAGARTVLEVGTLGGYSTIWLARALPPGGRLVTLELDEGHAELARANLAAAGLSDVVELRVGRATDALAALDEEGAGPFDLVFIDADKASTPTYFELSLKLVRPGGIILVDNVVRDGALVQEGTGDEGALGMRRFHELAGHRQGVQATTIQTVGVKGYDGFTLVLVDGA